MPLDVDLAYQLLGEHLGQEGLAPAFVRDRLRIGVGELAVRIEVHETDIRGAPGTLVWVEVTGFDGDRPMRLDVSGWGVTATDQAVDLAHGILDSILPVARRVVGDPRLPAAKADATITSMTGGGDPMPWDAWIGIPWVIAGGTAGDRDVQVGGTKVRDLWAKLDPPVLARILDPLTGLLGDHRPHWVKVYVARVGDQTSGRIDFDGEPTLDGGRVFADVRWPSGPTLRIVRQLLMVRPVPERAADAQQLDALERHRAGEASGNDPKRRWWQRGR